MTQKACDLIDEVVLTNLGHAPEEARLRAYQDLADYIEELEKKAGVTD
jgi:hypothetical protein